MREQRTWELRRLENLSSALKLRRVFRAPLRAVPHFTSPDDQDWQSHGPGSGRERAQGRALPQEQGDEEQVRGSEDSAPLS